MTASDKSAVAYSSQLRLEYVELARQVLNKSELDYNSLYRQFAGNQWACEQLDRKVAVLALQNLTPTQTAYLMAQSPHAQYEINEKGANPESLIPYAKAIVSHGLSNLRSPQVLWDRYSQGVEARIPAQKTQAVIQNAMRDGHDRETIVQLLKIDPEYKKIETTMGRDKAQQYVQLAYASAIRAEKVRSLPNMVQQSQRRQIEMET